MFAEDELYFYSYIFDDDIKVNFGPANYGEEPSLSMSARSLADESTLILSLGVLHVLQVYLLYDSLIWQIDSPFLVSVVTLILCKRGSDCFQAANVDNILKCFLQF